MKIVISLLFLIATCNCAVEFSDRPRNFSIELIYHTQAETGGHIVISPFGVWTLMTGIALGATGDSFKQVASAILLPREAELVNDYKELTSTVLNPKTKDVSLTSTNFVFLDDNFKVFADFRRTIQSDFNASIHILDFEHPQSADLANKEIEKTGANVKNVLQSNDFTHSVMLLTNVIAFRGVWSSPFNKSATEEEVFYDEKENPIGHVNMMYQNLAVRFSNIKRLQAHCMEMPYGTDGKYSMLFILPYIGVKVIDVYTQFAEVTIKDIFKKLEDDEQYFDKQEIDVKIPRFHISSNVVLNKPLNNMGVYDIFEPNRAKFGKVANDDIFVSAIVHKADIEVTETGTVASASTSANFMDKMSSSKFHANRPFIYFLMEKTTSTIIFGGIYSKPTVY